MHIVSGQVVFAKGLSLGYTLSGAVGLRGILSPGQIVSLGRLSPGQIISGHIVSGQVVWGHHVPPPIHFDILKEFLVELKLLSCP